MTVHFANTPVIETVSPILHARAPGADTQTHVYLPIAEARP